MAEPELVGAASVLPDPVGLEPLPVVIVALALLSSLELESSLPPLPPLPPVGLGVPPWLASK